MESIESFVCGKGAEEIKLNCIFFQRNLFEFLARLGVGQGLINMFSDVLQENIFDIHLSRTIDQDQDE